MLDFLSGLCPQTGWLLEYLSLMEAGLLYPAVCLLMKAVEVEKRLWVLLLMYDLYLCLCQLQAEAEAWWIHSCQLLNQIPCPRFFPMTVVVDLCFDQPSVEVGPCRKSPTKMAEATAYDRSSELHSAHRLCLRKRLQHLAQLAAEELGGLAPPSALLQLALEHWAPTVLLVAVMLVVAI